MDKFKKLRGLIAKCHPNNRPTRADFEAADEEYMKVKDDSQELYHLGGRLGRYEVAVNPTWRSKHVGPVERWTSV